MSSGYTSRNGNQEIAYHFRNPLTGERKRHKLRLGAVSVDVREAIRSSLDELVKCREFGLPAPADIRIWLQKVGPELHDQLVRHGVVRQRVEVTLAKLCQHHIDQLSRNERAQSTLYNMRLTGERLIACFGGDRNIRSFNTADAREFSRWLAAHPDQLAVATRSRTERRAREIFKAAVKERWLKRNPFSELKGGIETNHDRDAYIPWNEFQKVLEKGTCPRFKLFLVITRVCGIRSPSDVLPLLWSNIDRELEIMRVSSQKNKRYRPNRDIPIFEELRPHLSLAYMEAPEGEDRVFYDLPATHASLRNRLEAMCRRAGVVLWPKPFNNLRASGERDMWRLLRFDEVAAILDHTPETAMKHYNRVAKELRAKAEGRVTAYPNLGYGNS